MKLTKIINYIAFALLLVLFIVLGILFWFRSNIMELGEIVVADFIAGNISEIYDEEVMTNYATLDDFQQVVDLYGIEGAEFIDWDSYDTGGKIKKISGDFRLENEKEQSFTFFFVKVDGELRFFDFMKLENTTEEEK